MNLEQGRHATVGLIKPLREIFPLRFPVDRFHLQRSAAGLIARIVGGAEAAIEVSRLERQADLAILVRSVFEHVAVLAWLTGDRKQAHSRMLMWQRANDEVALQVNREAETILGRDPLFDEQQRAQIQDDVEAMGKIRMPPLADLAQIADREWKDRGAFDSIGETSLRGTYTALYRPMSGVVHPTQLGLLFVSKRQPDETISVDLEAPGDGSVVTLLGIAGMLLATVLISTEVLGRPDPEDVEPALDEAMRLVLGEQPS